MAEEAAQEISKKLAENYPEDEDDLFEDEKAWNKTKDEVAKQWRKRFCK